MKVTPAIESAGYGITGYIGGLPRTTYYTPDGRTILAIPQIREYIVKDKDGKTIRSGTRDANLDKGWLLTKPKTLQKFCRWCDAWHKTTKEITECEVKQKHLISGMARKTKTETTDKESALEKEVAELKEMVKQLMEKK